MPGFLTNGPDGALWFIANDETGEGRTGTVWRMTASGSPTQVYAAPSLFLEAITSGPDGALWCTDVGANQIGRITTSGAITEFSLASQTQYIAAEAIVVGPDGNLWIVEAGGQPGGAVTSIHP